MRNSNAEKITNKIKSLCDGTVFIANDFLEITEYETVRRMLNRLTDEGKIQKIMRGIYYCPRYSELLHEYEAPSPHQTAMAIARKFNWNIAPSGSTALNLLGLSTQVSAKWSYISDGPYNKYELGKITIEYKRRNNREIAGMSYKTALIIQGIKALGKNNIDEAAIDKIQSALTKTEKQNLLKEAKSSNVWVFGVIKKICGGN